MKSREPKIAITRLGVSRKNIPAVGVGVGRDDDSARSSGHIDAWEYVRLGSKLGRSCPVLPDAP